MDVNVHATCTKPTEGRLIGFADFVRIARRFIVGRVMGGGRCLGAGEPFMTATDENGLFNARGHDASIRLRHSAQRLTLIMLIDRRAGLSLCEAPCGAPVGRGYK